MNRSVDLQEYIRRFNEDEAICCIYERKRDMRRRFAPSFPLAEEILDHLDWLEAEMAGRKTRCIGSLVQ